MEEHPVETSESEEKGIEGVMAEVEKTAEEVETLSVEVMVIELASQRPEEGTEIPSEETEAMVREKVNPLEEVRRRGQYRLHHFTQSMDTLLFRLLHSFISLPFPRLGNQIVTQVIPTVFICIILCFCLRF